MTQHDLDQKSFTMHYIRIVELQKTRINSQRMTLIGCLEFRNDVLQLMQCTILHQIQRGNFTEMNDIGKLSVLFLPNISAQKMRQKNCQQHWQIPCTTAATEMLDSVEWGSYVDILSATETTEQLIYISYGIWNKQISHVSQNIGAFV